MQDKRIWESIDRPIRSKKMKIEKLLKCIQSLLTFLKEREQKWLLTNLKNKTPILINDTICALNTFMRFISMKRNSFIMKYIYDHDMKKEDISKCFRPIRKTGNMIEDKDLLSKKKKSEKNWDHIIFYSSVTTIESD